MIKSIKSFLIILVSLVALASSTLDELNKKLINLYKQGEFQKIIEIAQSEENKFIKEDKKELSELALYHNIIGGTYLETKDFLKAESQFREAVKLEDSNPKKNNIEFAKLLKGLGISLFLQNKFEEAKPIVIHARDLQEKDLGINDEVLNSCELLYEIYDRLGNDEEKRKLNEEYYKKSLLKQNAYDLFSSKNIKELYFESPDPSFKIKVPNDWFMATKKDSNSGLNVAIFSAVNLEESFSKNIFDSFNFPHITISLFSVENNISILEISANSQKMPKQMV